jgi:hypothetical protein
LRNHPAQNKTKLNPGRDKLVGLSAIGQSLKDHHRPRASNATAPRIGAANS